MPTADTNNNITVTIYDGIATLGSDYNTSGVTSNIHLPLSKVVWGNENVSRRVSYEYPMPVDIMSIGGFSGAASSFNVAGVGRFYVGNTLGSSLIVVGAGITNTSYSPVSVYGKIEGITNGVLVGITTGPLTISNSSIGVHGIVGATAIAVSGTITVTGERYSSSSTDSITVVGISMGSSSLVDYSKDSVKIRGSSGELYVPTRLYYGATAIGTSGDALKVFIVDNGLTFNVSVSATVGVTNGSNGSLKIQGGSTADNPLLIKFYDASTTIPVRFGTTQDTQLTTIKTNTDKIININDKLTSNTFNVRVVESPRPRNVLSGTQVPTTSPQPLASTSSIILRSGINIKSPITNTSTIFVGSSTIVANTAAAYPLEPGESLFIECDNITSLYCYAIIDVEKQKIIYIGS
jgi:hypothetical protein